MDHKWKADADGAESCEREGCTVRHSGLPGVGMWQRKKGAHWRLEPDEPLPPCAGKEAGEAKPAPAALEVVRARFHDFIKRKTPSTNEESYWRSALATLEESIREEATRFYREREAYFAGVFNVSDAGQFRADWEGAVKRWEESIRKDEREDVARYFQTVRTQAGVLVADLIHNRK